MFQKCFLNLSKCWTLGTVGRDTFQLLQFVYSVQEKGTDSTKIRCTRCLPVTGRGLPSSVPAGNFQFSLVGHFAGTTQKVLMHALWNGWDYCTFCCKTRASIKNPSCNTLINSVDMFALLERLTQSCVAPKGSDERALLEQQKRISTQEGSIKCLLRRSRSIITQIMLFKYTVGNFKFPCFSQ